MVSENKISEIRIAYEALAYISPNHELLRYFAIDRKGNLAFRTEESIQDFRRRFGEDVLEVL